MLEDLSLLNIKLLEHFKTKVDKDGKRNNFRSITILNEAISMLTLNIADK